VHKICIPGGKEENMYNDIIIIIIITKTRVEEEEEQEVKMEGKQNKGDV